jgi:UTP--glucose-1-phosphate uridylyltransferase
MNKARILIAPNALKGSLSARQAAEAMARGIISVLPDARVACLPIADGGDGTLAVLQEALQADTVRVTVQGPLGDPVAASYLFSPATHTAVIEMSAAAGMALLTPEQLNPLRTSSHGVGELILHAALAGARHIIVGLGGSATNDGGTGMATALGVRFLDAQHNPLAGTGENLAHISTIDRSQLHPLLAQIDVQAICDVNNPLLGAQGATHAFGPQKGADSAMLQQLEAGMANLAKRLDPQQTDPPQPLPGAGAAGGLGAMLHLLLKAQLRPGAELILDLLEIDQHLADVQLLLTAEGQLDEQSIHGKAPAAVAQRAAARGVPCIALAGSLHISDEQLDACGIQAAFSLCPGPVTLEQAMGNAADFLSRTSAQVVRSFFHPSSQQQTTGKTMSHPSMIKKCIFPAAGYGTRFLPATKAMPKEMLPILDKPLIQYGVEEAMEAGMTEIGIITGRSKRAVEDHFDISYELEHQISGTPKEAYLAGIRKIIGQCTFSYTRQIEMRGLGHAILTAQTLVGEEPFGVILADDLCINESHEGGVMQQMLRVYEKYRCSVVAIEEVDPEEVHKYGVIDASALDNNVFKVNGMVEKPAKEDAPSNLAIIGRYILTPEIFDIIRRTPPGKNGELQITDALQTQAKENMVLAYRFEGERFDCGSLHGFVDATNYFYRLLKKHDE